MDAKRKPEAVGRPAQHSSRLSPEQVERYAAYVADSPLPLIVTDARGRCVEVNAAACQMSGYEQAELLGMSAVDFLAEESRAAGLRHSTRLKEFGRTSGELCWLRKDGSQRWSAFVAQQAPDGHTLTFSVEITDRKDLEKSLRQSAHRLKAIIEATSESVCLLDAAGRILTCNSTMAARLDTTADNLSGSCVYDFLPPEVAELRRTQILKVFHSGASLAFEDRREDVWYHTTLYPIFDFAGAVASVAVFGRNISERRRTEEQLRLQALALNQIQDQVTVTDLDGKITYVNDAACRFWRRSRAALIGQPVAMYSAAVERGPTYDGMMQEILTKGVWRGEIVSRAPDGSECIEDCRTCLVKDADDRPVALCGIATNITDRKRAEQEKLEMERRLLHAQKLESLGILAGGIAHDFNNILAGIMGYADLALVQLAATHPARANIETLKKGVCRAADLTRQMLAYSGQGKFVVETLSLSQVVDDMRGLLEMSVSKKAVLQYNLAADLPAIEADASQMHQVILNLVINASEALGEHDGRITVATAAIHCNRADLAAAHGASDLHKGLYVRLEVADTGCGIERAALGKIYEPFFSTKFVGRGLGLAAVHGIVRGHKGAILVTSQPGEGTAFQALFPASGRPLAVTHDPPPETAQRGSGTVLIVDDDEMVRNLAGMMLERAGFSVLQAADGEEALRLFRQRQNDIACVLLDLTMPRMDGEETFRELRRICPQVRVVLSSGYSEEKATGQFCGLGLAGFIQKPYQLAALTAVIQRAAADAPERRPAAAPAEEPWPAACVSAAGAALPRSAEQPATENRRGGRTVLIIDDDQLGRESAAALFRQAGFSVLTVEDGPAAIEAHRTFGEQINAFFLDLNMPRMNGEETLRALRRMGARAHAIVSSGCAAATLVKRFADLDVLGFVQKPEPLDAIIAKLHDAIGRAP